MRPSSKEGARKLRDLDGGKVVSGGVVIGNSGVVFQGGRHFPEIRSGESLVKEKENKKHFGIHASFFISLPFNFNFFLIFLLFNIFFLFI